MRPTVTAGALTAHRRPNERINAALQTTRGALVARIAVVGVILLLWYLAGAFGIVDRFLASSPQAVATAWPHLLSDAEVRSALGQTAVAILIAFVIATVTGILAGFLIGWAPLIRRAYYPAFLFLLSTPKVVFVPLFMLVFGIGPAAVIAFGAFQAFFYVTVTVVGGVDLVGSRELRLARAFRATKFQTFVHVVVPATSHALFAAVWFGISQAFTGALIVELFVSAGGVGQLLSQYQRSLHADSVIALALTLSIVAILCGTAVTWVEAKVCKWRLRKET